MAYTYDDFKTYLKLRFGNNDAWDNYYGTWVNSGYSMLVNRTKWGDRAIDFPELITSTDLTTTDGTAYVTTPDDCLHVVEVFDETSNVRLDWMSYPEYLSKTDRDTSTSESAPAYWTRSGAYIYLYPTPDATYTLRTQYRKRPAAMSDESDTTAVGDEWDDIILELATFIGRNWSGETERAEYSRKIADWMISGLLGVYSVEEKARREKLRPETSHVSSYRGGY